MVEVAEMAEMAVMAVEVAVAVAVTPVVQENVDINPVHELSVEHRPRKELGHGKQ